MKHIARCCCLVLAVALAGCFPEERVWWSPQGDRAVVRVRDRLHLMSADGTLSASLLGGASVKDWIALTLSWLPDGSGFVCGRSRKVAGWEATKKLIRADEVKRIEDSLPAVMPALEAVIALNKDLSGFEALVSSAPNQQRAVLAAGARVLFETRRGEVERVLRKLGEGEKIIAELAGGAAEFEVHELCVVRLDERVGAEPQSLVCMLLSAPLMPRMSPRHAALAFLELRDDADEVIDLKVMSLDGKASLTVEQDVSTGAFDWMPDGRALVFTRSMGKGDDSIQSIRRIIALQENGALMKPRHDAQPDGSQLKVEAPDRLPEAETLALAIMPAHPTLRALPDGRVLFASQPVTLPAAGAGPELAPRLYLIAKDGGAVTAIPTAPGDLPADLNFFVASPDGKRIAVVEEGTDALAIVEVSNGRTEIISAPHPGWHCETVPSWKSTTELAFAALDEKTKTPRMMLWRAGGGVRNITAQWPADAASDWLTERKSNQVP